MNKKLWWALFTYGIIQLVFTLHLLYEAFND